MPSTHPARLKFLDRVNYFGQVGEFDAQGRVLIPPRLREAAGMTGEVDVLGPVEYLEVWNHERSWRSCSASRSRMTTRGRSRSSGSEPTHEPVLVAEVAAHLRPETRRRVRGLRRSGWADIRAALARGGRGSA